MIPLRRALLSGVLAAAAGLAAGELAAGAIRGAASPVVPPGQILIDHVPLGVKEWAIRNFGTADKAVLVLGALLVLVGLGLLVGRLVASGRWRTALAVQGVTAVLGVAAVLDRPSPSFGKVMPPLVASAVAATVLWWLVRRPSGRPEASAVGPAELGRVDQSSESALVPSRVPVMGLDRRTVITSTVAVVSGVAVTGGLGRWLARRHEIGAERATIALPAASDTAAPLVSGVDFGLAGVDPFVTTTAGFYRIDTAIVVPQISRDGWKLKVHGMVDHELSISYDELVSRPIVERYLTLSCVSNEVGGDLVGNALFSGVRLADVLAEAGIDPAATQLASRSADGWTCGTPMSAVTDGRDALLAVAMNGEPLSAKHGYPVRMVVPGLYGYVSATKWLTELEATTWEAFQGYWVPRGWSALGPVKVMSRIDTPKARRQIPAGVTPIAGLAWAMHRGIASVEVKIDGADWIPAVLADAPSADTWRQWRHDWDATPGDHVIEVRATTLDGEVQTVDVADVAPDGATGHHTIRVTVA